MYFLISAFITPIPLFVLPVRALSDAPSWSGPWCSLGFESGQLTLSFGGGYYYENYNYAVWVKQAMDETDPFVDYYGVVVRFYSDFESGTVNPVEVETKVKIIEEPTDTSNLSPNGGPEDWDKDQGVYDYAWSGDLKVKIAINPVTVNTTIDWTFYRLYIQVGTGKNYILWDNTQTYLGSFLQSSALGSYDDERCVVIMSVPDASSNGGETTHPDDGDLYIYLYVKGYFTYYGGSTITSTASTTVKLFDLFDYNPGLYS